jgi:hypothetical protein
VVAILTPIYEAEFLGFSYGFRPRRNQHQALDALAVGIGKRRINWILDADIQSFFDTVSQEWLIRFIEHRDNKTGSTGTKQSSSLQTLKMRLACFGLAEFGRFAIANRRARGLGNPELSRLHALLREPSGWRRLRPRAEASPNAACAPSCEKSRDPPIESR